MESEWKRRNGLQCSCKPWGLFISWEWGKRESRGQAGFTRWLSGVSDQVDSRGEGRQQILFPWCWFGRADGGNRPASPWDGR